MTKGLPRDRERGYSFAIIVQNVIRKERVAKEAKRCFSFWWMGCVENSILCKLKPPRG